MRVRRCVKLARTCRRGWRLTLARARSRISSAPAERHALAKTSRAMRRTRLRVVAAPAVRPSATMRRPSRAGAASAHTVHGPVFSRTPRLRSRPAAVSPPRLAIRARSDLDCEPVSALGAASLEDPPAANSAHALQESMGSLAFATVWLIRPLHGSSVWAVGRPIIFRHAFLCQVVQSGPVTQRGALPNLPHRPSALSAGLNLYRNHRCFHIQFPIYLPRPIPLSDGQARLLHPSFAMDEMATTD